MGHLFLVVLTKTVNIKWVTLITLRKLTIFGSAIPLPIFAHNYYKIERVSIYVEIVIRDSGVFFLQDCGDGEKRPNKKVLT
jgi:hypothetical protein